MEDVETTYVNILSGPEALANHSPAFTRHWLKDKIMAELPSIRSVLQKSRQSPAVLYCPAACEADMVQSAIITDDMDHMKCVYKSAQLIRQAIDDFSKAEKSQGFIPVSSTLNNVPAELYSLIRWILVGPTEELETEVRTHRVHRDALTISQNIMFALKSKRQITYQPIRKCACFRSQHIRENPQVLGEALNKLSLLWTE